MSKVGKLIEHEGPDARRADSEEIPVWADAICRRLDALEARDDTLRNKGGDLEPPRVGMDEGEDDPRPEETGEGKRAFEEYEEEHRLENEDTGPVKSDEGESPIGDPKAEPHPNHELENGVIRENTEGLRGAEARDRPPIRADLRGHRSDESEREAKEHEAEGGRKANEELRKERERADAAMKENRALKAKIEEHDAMIRRIVTPLTNEERDELSQARSRADSVFHALGLDVSEPLHGEKPISYRKRLVNQLKKYSDSFKDENIDRLDGAVFSRIEHEVFADALKASNSTSITPAGTLRPREYTRGGLTFTEYSGDNLGWMAPFMSGGTSVRLNRHPGRS